MSPRQQLALQALLAGHSVEAAAAQANVHKSSIFRWLREPLFASSLQAAQDEAARVASTAMLNEAREMGKLHAQAARQMMTVALEQLQMRLAESARWTVEDIRKWLGDGMKLERLARGMAEASVEQQVTGPGGMAMEKLSREERVALFEFYCNGEGPE